MAASAWSEPRVGRLASGLLHLSGHLGTQTFLNIGFQHAEHRFMPLHGHLQRGQQSLGGEEIHDNPLLDLDRILRNPDRLGIESKVDDQFFR